MLRKVSRLPGEFGLEWNSEGKSGNGNEKCHLDVLVGEAEPPWFKASAAEAASLANDPESGDTWARKRGVLKRGNLVFGRSLMAVLKSSSS
jgi:hypothetical protein